MSLSSLHLDAFAAVCRERNFSHAAKTLHITQSALSQRIAGLEEQLGISLIVRSRDFRLTPAGERLLEYSQAREGLEAELIADLVGENKESLAGTLTIAAYSSVMRSCVLPVLAKLQHETPELRFHYLTAETYQLEAALRSGEADIVVTDTRPNSTRVVVDEVGEEVSVIVESKRGARDSTHYFDHDSKDRTTANYFSQARGIPRPETITFCDEVYTILDAVAEGLGRAVMPLHLIDKRLVMVPRCGEMRNPVYLTYLDQRRYSRVHKRAVDALRVGMPERLLKHG